ncbi:MAG TPA: 3-hydroxyacyl-CoA dehydrogenase NAD-binding domain-containing protein [Longimicrobiales bacterium]|nr:3-hydroxyacyl-CoA dehydrogenase NAD-binding domain-containing protein [Longimicrobiales bacterium]
MSADTANRTTVRLDVAAGLAEVVFDNPAGKAVVLTSDVMRRLDGILSEIEGLARAGDVRAVVFRSAKDGMFVAGVNVDEIADVTDRDEARDKARQGQQLFRRVDHLPVPSVAAIDGTCLGGGTELALACTWRIASDRRETKIGLPEVRLGIIPGFGGTTRLPRLIGLPAALDLILTGRTLDARRAQRVGLIDERVHPSILLRRARELAREAAAGQRPDRSLPLTQRLMAGPARKLVLRKARAGVMKETRGAYPAPLRALRVIDEGLGRSVDRQLALEADAVAELVPTGVSKNLIHVFHLMEDAKKAAPSADPQPVERVGVLGAGVMGGGIAQLLAYNSVGVRLKDIQEQALGLGLRHARELFDKAVKSRRMQRREADQAMNRISPTLEYSGFGSLDLVIEAVVERMDVKKSVLREVEGRVDAECVLTSNTSSLSITEMAAALERPERFAGMHFFNPVHRMPLVEVVRGERTSDETVATVFRLARDLGKTPIIVRDGPGFLVNRLLAPYLNEAGWLLSEGASIEQVDRVMVEFGMPMGPFRLLDEVGLDVARHAAETMHASFGERFRPSPPLAALARLDRLGRKGDSGFYVYEDGREKGVDGSIYAALGSDVPTERRKMNDETIRTRLLYPMVNEAARVLEDGIVRNAGDVDLGLITGTGFPPFRGGLLRWADTIGLHNIAQRLGHWKSQHGPRFAPAPSLKDRNSFY